MSSIIGHHLIAGQEGYQVLLYVDAQLIEAADGFEASSQRKKDLRRIINSYLKNKLPYLKVHGIKIMLGSLVIATISLTAGATIQELDLNQKLNLKNISNETTKVSGEKEFVKTKSASRDILLVNKNNSLAGNYLPLNLIVPAVPFSFEGFQEKKLMQEQAAEALEELFTEAQADNIDLYAVSGYRSYQRQESIFKRQVARYGLLQANQVSARPGESEHQTGLAMDVTSPQVNFKLVQDFGTTKAGQWLQEHAAQFGFIIRYPTGKEEITGYQYEPWHIRYVGTKVAQKIVSRGLTLEEYLA